VVRARRDGKKARDRSRRLKPIARGHLYACGPRELRRLTAIRKEVELHKVKLKTRNRVGDQRHFDTRFGRIAGGKEQRECQEEERRDRTKAQGRGHPLTMPEASAEHTRQEVFARVNFSQRDRA